MKLTDKQLLPINMKQQLTWFSCLHTYSSIIYFLQANDLLIITINHCQQRLILKSCFQSYRTNVGEHQLHQDCQKKQHNTSSSSMGKQVTDSVPWESISHSVWGGEGGVVRCRPIGGGRFLQFTKQAPPTFRLPVSLTSFRGISNLLQFTNIFASIKKHITDLPAATHSSGRDLSYPFQFLFLKARLAL